MITRVTLRDYGVYRGYNAFEFGCHQDKPVTLVGGANGAGKTTLFEAVPLCLYGMRSLGKRTGREEYEKLLASRIHRPHGDPAPVGRASIEVRFKISRHGKETEYCVERSWDANGDCADERLSVKSRHGDNGESWSPEVAEEDHRQAFIDDMVPRGIYEMFFIDGEKVASMAESDSEGAVIRESFRSLFGLDLVDQLSSDLQVNMVRNLTGGGKRLRHEHDKHMAEKEDLKVGTESLRHRLAQKQKEADELRSEIDSVEVQISRVGGVFAASRENAKGRLAEKQAVAGSLRGRISELCSDVLPFSMIPGEMGRLVEQIGKDREAQKEDAGHEVLGARIDSMVSRIRSRGFWSDAGLGGDAADAAAELVSSLLDSSRGPKGARSQVHGFSENQAASITSAAVRASGEALEDLKRETKLLASLNEEITALEASLARAPGDDELGPLMSRMGDLNRQAGMLQAEMDHIEERISANKAMRQHIDAKLREVVAQMYKTEKSRTHVDLTRKVQGILAEFVDRLLDKKMGMMEGYLLDAVSTLMHKQDLIGGVSVNRETFEILLSRPRGGSLPRSELSKGEKQMLAVAVLWALARTSGRAMPFMIDTPLARLDAGHRDSIVERFLPQVSHQTMVFSTDKEIEIGDYRKLGPYLTRAYVMVYSDAEGCTKSNTGYFWNMEGEKTAQV